MDTHSILVNQMTLRNQIASLFTRTVPSGTVYRTIRARDSEGNPLFQDIPIFRANISKYDRSKYLPHQSARECTRRVAQRQNGSIK